PLPYGFSIDDLNQAANRIVWAPSGTVTWQDQVLGVGMDLSPDSASRTPDLAKLLVNTVGERASHSMKVEVKFEKLLSAAGLTTDTWWSGSSAAHLDVPLGFRSAGKVQFMTLGESAHHGLMVGRTGSGKTNLMHVMIASLVTSYSPD